MAKKGFDTKKLSQFFVEHGEKLGLGVVLLLTLYAFYCASAIVPFEKTPDDLQRAIGAASQNIENSEIDLAEQQIVIPQVTYKERIVALGATPIDPSPYALRPLLNYPLFDRKVRRGEPTYPPVEAPRAAFAYGPIAVRQGNNTAPMGKEWIVVTGLVPLRQQTEEYLRVFQNALIANARGDKPVYLGFELQRAEVTSGAPPADGDWVDVDLSKYLEARKAWAQTERDAIDSKLLDANLAVALPQLVGATHDPAVIGRSEVITPEQEAAQKQPEAAPTPEPPPAATGGRIRLGGAPATSAPLRPAPPPAGVTAQTSVPRYLLFRYVDFEVVPNKVYVYRVRLVLENPNHQIPPQFLQKPDLAAAPESFSPWSEPTAPVRVPPPHFVYAGDVAPAIGGNLEPTATFAVKKWIPAKGADVWARFEKLARGQLLNFDNQPVSYPKPGKSETAEESLSFQTNEVLIDMVGGGSLPGVPRPAKGFGSLLLMSETGELHAQFARDDLASYLGAKGGTAKPGTKPPSGDDRGLPPGSTESEGSAAGADLDKAAQLLEDLQPGKKK